MQAEPDIPDIRRQVIRPARINWFNPPPEHNVEAAPPPMRVTRNQRREIPEANPLIAPARLNVPHIPPVPPLPQQPQLQPPRPQQPRPHRHDRNLDRVGELMFEPLNDNPFFVELDF